MTIYDIYIYIHICVCAWMSNHITHRPITAKTHDAKPPFAIPALARGYSYRVPAAWRVLNERPLVSIRNWFGGTLMGFTLLGAEKLRENPRRNGLLGVSRLQGEAPSTWLIHSRFPLLLETITFWVLMSLLGENYGNMLRGEGLWLMLKWNIGVIKVLILGEK